MSTRGDDARLSKKREGNDIEAPPLKKKRLNKKRYNVTQEVANLLYPPAALIDAIKSQDMVLLNNCLSAEPSFANYTFANGLTPILIACKENNLPAVTVLIKFRASLNVFSRSRRGALYFAAKSGSMPMIKFVSSEMMKQGLCMDQITKNGFSVMMAAAREAPEEHLVDILRFLVRLGLSITYVDPFGVTLVHLVARRGCYKALRFLVEEHNADHTLVTQRGVSPMFISCKHGRLDCVTYLLGKGIDIHDTVRGNSLLMLSVWNGHESVTELLLRHGADTNFTDPCSSTTVLMHAALKNDAKAIRLLCEFKADVNLLDDRGFTALHVAADRDHVEAAKALVDCKAMITGGDEDCALDVALENDSEKTLLFFIDVLGGGAHGDTAIRCFGLASRSGHFNVVKSLVLKGVPINVRYMGDTALYSACEYGHMQVVKYLLENGASMSITSHIEETPLHIASRKGHASIVSLLISYIVSRALSPAARYDELDARNGSDFSALAIACFDGKLEIVRLLCGAGAYVNTRERLIGRTPIHLALENSNAEIINVLHQFGADVNQVDENELSPLCIAACEEDELAVATLLKCGAYISSVPFGSGRMFVNKVKEKLLYQEIERSDVLISDLIRMIMEYAKMD